MPKISRSYDELINECVSAYINITNTSVEESLARKSLYSILSEAVDKQEAVRLKKIIDGSVNVVDEYMAAFEGLDEKPEYILDYLQLIDNELREIEKQFPKITKMTSPKADELAENITEIGSYSLSVAKSINNSFAKVVKAIEKVPEFGEQTTSINELAEGGDDISEDVQKLASQIVSQIERAVRPPGEGVGGSGSGILAKMFKALFGDTKIKKFDTSAFAADIIQMSPAEISSLSEILSEANADSANASKAVTATIKNQSSEEKGKKDEKEEDSETDLPDVSFDKSSQASIIDAIDDELEKAESDADGVAVWNFMKQAINKSAKRTVFESKEVVNSLDRWKDLAGITQQDDNE